MYWEWHSGWCSHFELELFQTDLTSFLKKGQQFQLFSAVFPPFTPTFSDKTVHFVHKIFCIFFTGLFTGYAAHHQHPFIVINSQGCNICWSTPVLTGFSYGPACFCSYQIHICYLYFTYISLICYLFITFLYRYMIYMCYICII